MFNSRNMFVNWTKIFQLFSRKNIGGVVRIPPFVSIGSFRRKKTFSGNACDFFYVFRTLSRELSVFCQKNFVGLSKLHFTCPCDQFEERVFWKNYGLVITFGLRSTIFQHFVDLISTGFSKLHSTCSKEQYEESKIIWDKIFLSFSDFELITFGHFLKLFWWCCGNWIFSANGIIYNFLKNLCFSYRVRTLNEEKMALVQKLCGRKA